MPWYCWPFAVLAGLYALPFVGSFCLWILFWAAKLLWKVLKALWPSPDSWYRKALSAWVEWLDRND